MKKRSYAGEYFLLSVAILYLVIGFFKIDLILPSLIFSLKILKNIVPVLVLVFVLMTLVEYYIPPKAISKYVGKSSGIKKWVVAIVGGIISTGPIYMWYPMLKELKKQGASYGFVATFLYNRAIKIPLIPLLIFYFGLEYVIILTVVMMIMSVIIGLIFDKIENFWEK